MLVKDDELNHLINFLMKTEKIYKEFGGSCFRKNITLMDKHMLI